MIELVDFMMQQFVLGVILSMLFDLILTLEIYHIRQFIKVQFVNKGIEFINSASISKDKSVFSSIPAYF